MEGQIAHDDQLSYSQKVTRKREREKQVIVNKLSEKSVCVLCGRALLIDHIFLARQGPPGPPAWEFAGSRRLEKYRAERAVHIKKKLDRPANIDIFIEIHVYLR